MSKDSIVRIPPLSYIHVLDTNSNITRLEIGPQTFVRKEHETLIVGPKKMIKIPPQYYCEVENPVVRNDKKELLFEPHGEVKLSFGDSEIRFSQDPFPLYPGELLKVDVTAQPVVTANCALRLKATLHVFDHKNIERNAGDEWLFEGPGIFKPQRGVKVEENIEARVIMPGHALKLCARKEFVDRLGVQRVTGEVWLIKTTGAYLPDAYERVVEFVKAYVLTEKTSLHMRAIKTFTDDFNVVRKNGEEWLITSKETDTHIPNVYEEVVCEESIVTLTNRQYCVILDPVDAKGKPQLGKKRLIRGEKSFFLMPGESLEQGIQDVYILGENEGLILKCIEEYKDGEVTRRPGDLWMITGPLETVPPIQVEVITKRKAIAMDKNEGIYVKDVNTGTVRSVTGQTYMLTQNEELWAKELPEVVEGLLLSTKDPLADRSDRRADKSSSTGQPKTRDKTKVVTFRVPHNAAVQIYDYKEKSARVVFGPDLVMLGHDEHFTLLSLSGGKPKRPNAIKSLCLLLGPDFMTDIITVETADHARLSLQLSYNWHFKLPEKVENSAKLFSVPDFVGDACKAIASRIRGYVAAVQFDDFHKNSARIIRTSVFGLGDDQKVRDEFHFKQNNLYITSIDIQSVEPVDQRTREALQKSVQLAIEITTKSQEATARHEAERLEQEAKGRLDRQIIDDESAAENSRIRLLDLKAKCAAVESTGQAKAEAQSMAERLKIEGEAQVEQAKLKAAASSIEAECELERMKSAREAELNYVARQNELEVNRAEKLSQIETERYKNMINSIGTETLKSIALAGPDLEVRLLQSLGMKTTLITDGNSPINLFSTAHGLIGKALTGSSTHHSGDHPTPMKQPRVDDFEDN